ncbi:MAG TPA: ABC transporter permease [Terracidiphilus sp.]|jgi:lipopolysaccharide transport system permease protein
MKSKLLSELWRYRELLYFFAWRDIKVRYRQAAFGAAWAIIQPLFNMIIFSLLFGKVAHFSAGNVPYPVFVFCGLLPWTYISGVITFASSSLINNDPLLTKVYFPRAFLPLASVLAGLIDFSISGLLLVVIMFYYHVRAGSMILLLPGIIFAMVLLSAGVSMITSAMSVRYRDVRYALPFLIQVWMFATPIVYPATAIPLRYRPLLAINPCWGIVDGLRACVLKGVPIDVGLVCSSLGMAFLIFAVGVFYFRREERIFADVI